MKKILFAIILFAFTSCTTEIVKKDSSLQTVKFEIELANYHDDIFHVSVAVENLDEDNNVYNFAATAPGTYQVLDFGRFVKEIRGFDEHRNELNIERIETNKWKIENVERLKVLEYKIEDSFDAEIDNNPVSPMCGSGIENDFIAINTFAVLGYFSGMQTNPVELKINYSTDWEIGTALIDKDNIYYAENYDHLADSPILIGDLTYSETFVNDISVQIYLFSEDTSITAGKIMDLAEDVLQSASGFIGYSPVQNYKFLMCLLADSTFVRNELYGGGALEHSYSSLYVMPASSGDLNYLRSTMAHEFLHILTPLFLHSEIIHTYNFEVPSPSMHIWLYEGVTEWASDIMQLRSGLINADEYFNIISGKLSSNDYFDQNISLTDMALTSYDQSGYGNFLNFYEKGAVTASLLDIKLLELSKGEFGLREIFLKLLKKYGRYKPFSEDDFFEELTEMTFPEIGIFINKYIKGNEKLPYQELYGKIGYKYIPERIIEEGRPSFGTNLSMNENMEIIAVGVHEEAYEWGLREGDILLEVMGENVNFESIKEIAKKAFQMKAGDPYSLKVKRGEEIIELEGKMLLRKQKHVFVEMDELSNSQIELRNIWLRNLDI